MDWVQWLLSFIGVLGLIFFLFYALKKLNKGISVKSGNRLRVLDRVSLGRDGMLLIVSVCGKLMLLGVTAHRVEKLCDLDISEEEYSASLQQQGIDFKSVLSSALNKKEQEKQGEDADDDASEKSNKTE